MNDAPLRFPQALAFALLAHAAALLLVRVPMVSPAPDPSRSLVVHLSAIAAQATAPDSQPRPAAPAMAAAAPASGVAAQPTPRPDAIDSTPRADFRSKPPEPIERAALEPDTPERPTDVPTEVPFQTPAETMPPAPAASTSPPAQDVPAQEVPSREIETAAVDDSVPLPPTDSAAKRDALVRASYQDVIAAWLRRHRRYPTHLRRRGVEGAGALRLRVDREGHVQLASMHTPIGDRRLDDLTLEMVRRAQPFPAMPQELSGETFECVIDIRYRLAE